MKNNEQAQGAAEQNREQSPKQYLRCGKAVKRGLVALAILASAMMVLGAQNMLRAAEVLTGQVTSRYMDSQAMHTDMMYAAQALSLYHGDLNSEEASEEDVALRYGFLESDGYRFCTVDEAGNRAAGNAGLEEIKALPVYVEAYGNGGWAVFVQDNQERTVSVPTNAVPIGYIGMPQAELDQREADNAWDFRAGWISVALLGTGGVLLALSAIALILKAGRRPESQDVFLMWYDWLYLDIQLCAALGWSVFGLSLAAHMFHVDSEPLSMIVQYAICISISLLCIAFLTSCSRRIKRGEFWRHTLIGVCCVKLWRLIRRAAAALMRFLKALSPTLLQGIMLVLFLIGLVLVWGFYRNGFTMLIGALMLAAVVTYLYTEQRIAEGIKRMRRGEADARIKAPRLSSALQRGLIDDLNHMAEGMEQAVAERVRAQSMRTELITNVSHDLKTPLTSILAYVELLRQSELPPPEGEYVEVLAQKGERLKRLTEDLFEAAKAASGSVPLRPERLDVAELIRQGLAELDDRIEKSGLDWRIELPEEPLYAMADGRHLWRVVENLCSNALKYAMPGTRVYLTAGAEGEAVTVTMKNISKEPLNIPADQLTERFVRGDSARSTEGSGLGLSIAKSLTELMGGRFTLTIDGDLFKAEVGVPGDPEAKGFR